MKLNNLKPAKGSLKSKKRIARGVGAGTGRTATRGHKGAKSRSGYSSKRAFEGGQMPLQMRLPKRGFKNTHRRYQANNPGSFTVLNLDKLGEIATANGLTALSSAVLASVNAIDSNATLKVLGNGELKSALEVSASRFSESAKKAITEAGGKAFVELKLNAVQGVAHAEGVETVNMALLTKHFSFLNESDLVHVVADGSISMKLTLEVHKISDEAKSQVEELGGSVTLL